MKLPPCRIARRQAFTLIELLVVVTIIAVLASLLLAAVFKALAVAKQVQNRNDITQLSAAIANFKQTLQVDYLPSVTPPPAEPNYGSRLYPQAGPWLPSLQGNQCLVFFLSGGPAVGYRGFSSDPTNPMAPPQPGEQRKGPFYDFPPNRINAQGQFVDVYGTPFAYFSTTGTPNSYTPGPNPGNPGCAGPYLEPGSSTYLNPDSFQIISAGPPTPGFGPIPLFNSSNRWPGVTDQRGKDDISNFATGQLGAGQ